MKLLFLVGCAEPGHDGVGDYTTILAQECETQGHQYRIASLYDRYVFDQPEIKASTWRFSNALKNKDEQNTLKALSEEFSPDWISLQFVPYGFHPKGLPWRLVKALDQMPHCARLHIMFHETWTGPHLNASLKDKAYGLLQQLILKHLLSKHPPDSVHTHASPYLHLLKNLGLQAKQLRLPSNIPIAPNNADTWLWESLLAQGISIDRDTRNQYLVLGIFGSIYPEWPTQEFCTKIKLLARAQKKTCLLLSIGHIGAGTATWDALCKEADEQLSAISLGRLDSKKVSEVLQSLDLGVATLPWELIEKGSSVATLLAHGLPVLVPRDDIHFPFSSQDPQENQLIKLSIPIPDILTRTSKTRPHDSLKLIALQFLADLNA